MNEEVWVEKGGWGNGKHGLYLIRTLVENLQQQLSMSSIKCSQPPHKAAGTGNKDDY